MTVLFPTFEEMLHPQRVDPAIRQSALSARAPKAPLDPINLFNIHLAQAGCRARTMACPPVNYLVMPRALTGVDAEIVVLIAKGLPYGEPQSRAGLFCAHREVHQRRDRAE
ncbi:MAG: hypothetical protein KatS3mg052_0378 [Candidatus Roseilinea sp.]|nr:MAG: hypothetical protein KatS3mg052_0378 [Candidatus Roseilinea sp.]